MGTKEKKKVEPCSHLPQTAPQARNSLDVSSSPEDAANGVVSSSSSAAKTNTTKKCDVCVQEKKAARVYRTKIIVGLLLPFTLQAFDTTVIASALPWIAADFGEISQLNWIVTAFNLTAAAFIPFWGQMADIFGRHWSLQAATFIVMVGSALCTAAPTYAFPVLLLGRGLQGVGSAGIGVIIETIIADKVSLSENAKNNSIFSFVAGTSWCVGPVLGGVLTRANWRWCFGINLPACVLSFIVLFLIRPILLGPQPIPRLDEHAGDEPSTLMSRLKIIDVGGQLLSLFGFGLMILAFTWAGANYDWNAAAVLVPLILGALLCVGFITWEYLMAPGRLLSRTFPLQQPMLPWKLIEQRNIGLLFFVNFASGMNIFAVLYFVNLYFTMVKGRDASDAGVQLLFYTPGLSCGVVLAILMCNVWPRKTWWAILLGSIFGAAGIASVAYSIYADSIPAVYGSMSLSGAGAGMLFMPGAIHAIGFFPEHISTIIAFMGLAGPFGGSLGITIMSTVFNNVSNIARDSPFRDFTNVSQMSAEALALIRDSARKAIAFSFVAITPFMFMCIVVALALGNVRITTDDIHTSDEKYRENLTERSYLLVLLGRKDHPMTGLKPTDEGPTLKA